MPGTVMAPTTPTLTAVVPLLVSASPALIPATPTLLSGIGITLVGTPALAAPGLQVLIPSSQVLAPAAAVLVMGGTLAVVEPLDALPTAYPIDLSGEDPSIAQPNDVLAGERDRTSRDSAKRHSTPGGGAANTQPAPVLMPLSGTGAGSSASGGSGFFFFGVAGMLALFALGVPRLCCRLRLIKELGTPAPFVLLLDRPG